MKIAYLSTFYPFRGGIAQFNGSLLKAFQEKKHTAKAFNFIRQYPDLLFPGKSQYVTAEDKAEPVENTRVLDTINPLTYFSAGLKIRNFEPDLMLMKFWMPFFAPGLGVAAGLNKKKSRIITILDNVIPHEKRPGDMLLTRFFLRQNHGFVVMSDAVRKDLLSLHPKAKYIYHPHPLFDHFGNSVPKVQAQKHLNLPADKKILLFFGFIRDYKGLDLLIKTLPLLENDYHLVIAGEVYGDFAPYQQLINELGLQERIHNFVRYINDEEVPYFFSAADVCVLPYRSATQSGITSIAFHFNLPVIATDTGGLKEVVKDNEYGLIIPEPEPSQIASKIRHFYLNALSAQFTANIQRFKESSSWTHLADTIIEFNKTLQK